MNNLLPVVPTVLSLFLFACAYSAQYWAKKCRDELVEIKEELRKQR